MKFRNLFVGRRQHKRGQNTAEYVVMLVLVAVGGISMASLFGQTIKKQFRNAVAGLGGTGEVQTTQDILNKADKAVKDGTGMDTKQDEIERVSF